LSSHRIRYQFHEDADIEEVQRALALGQASYIPKETALRVLESLKRAYRRLTLFGVAVIAGIF
jgi:hypothetical protein